MSQEKIPAEESKQKPSNDNDSRVNIIQVVNSPLQFFVLMALILDGIFGIIAAFSNGFDRTFLIISTPSIAVALIIIVAIIAFFRPESLHGRSVLPQNPPELKNLIDECIRSAISNITFTIKDEKIQAVLENQDIYLSVCLFRDGKTDKQKEQNKETLEFYRELQKKLEYVVQGDGRKIITRRDFFKYDDVINPGKMPDYANEAFDKITNCKYFIAVIQKVPDDISGGSHIIEIGYALAKGKPVLCYIEDTMYKPMFLRELNKPSHYRLVSYSNTSELFGRLEAVDTDFKSIEYI